MEERIKVRGRAKHRGLTLSCISPSRGREKQSQPLSPHFPMPSPRRGEGLRERGSDVAHRQPNDRELTQLSTSAGREPIAPGGERKDSDLMKELTLSHG